MIFGAKLSFQKILTNKWALATYVAFSPNSRFPLTSQSNKRNLDGSNIRWLWVGRSGVRLFVRRYFQVPPDLPVQQNFPRPDQTKPKKKMEKKDKTYQKENTFFRQKI